MSKMEEELKSNIEAYIETYGQLPGHILFTNFCFSNHYLKEAAFATLDSVVGEHKAAGWDVTWELLEGDVAKITIE